MAAMNEAKRPKKPRKPMSRPVLIALMSVLHFVIICVLVLTSFTLQGVAAESGPESMAA